MEKSGNFVFKFLWEPCYMYTVKATTDWIAVCAAVVRCAAILAIQVLEFHRAIELIQICDTLICLGKTALDSWFTIAINTNSFLLSCRKH